MPVRMPTRAKPYLIFVLLGLGAWLGIETSVEFLARLIVKGGGVTQNFEEGFMQALLMWKIAATYYVLLGLIAGSLAEKGGFKNARLLFILGAAGLGSIGYLCAEASQKALLNHAWTASALVYLGFLIYGAAVLLACLVIRLLAGRRMAKTQITTNMN